MEMQTHLRRTLTALTLLGLTVGATAEATSLYKWTDDEGNVHYSQTPPEHGKADRMEVKGDSKQAAEEPPERDLGPPEGAGQDPRQVQVRKRNCEIARANLEVYQSSERIKKPDGSVVTLSDEMRESKIKEAEAMIEANCR